MTATTTAPAPASRLSAGAGKKAPAVLDEATFAEVWRDTYSEIVGFVHRYQAVNRADAEDIACETFLKAWTHRDRYNPAAGTPDTWLLAIARRTAIDAYRYRARRPVLDLDPLQVLLVDDLDVADLVADRADTRTVVAMVWAAVAALTPVQRQAIHLRYVRGMSGDQAAQATGQTLSAVKSQLMRATKALRAALQVQAAACRVLADAIGGAA